jgi:hypothetical protein
MDRTIVGICLLSVAATGCSVFSSKNRPAIFAAGEKAKVGSLVYAVTDAEMTQQLSGDDPGSLRTAQDRFYLVNVNISNTGNEAQPVLAMTLVDDAGKSYGELADGRNVPKWLGVIRTVGAAHTAQGYIVFDAPPKHYRLRLNEPLDDREIAIDLPVDFVHEQTQSLQPVPDRPAELAIPTK